MLVRPLALHRARTIARALGHVWAECPALDYIDTEITLADLESIVQSDQVIDLFSTRGHLSSTGRLSVAVDSTTATISITVFRPIHALRQHRVGRPVLHVKLYGSPMLVDVSYRSTDCEARHLYSAQLLLQSFGFVTFEAEVLGAVKADLTRMVGPS